MSKIIPGIIYDDVPDNDFKYIRPVLTEVHIADIHFGVGAMSPKTQYEILKEQFIFKIQDINFDILSINGDLFDRKSMSNSDMVMYATMFIDEIVQLCKLKNATLVLIHGTKSHDSSQLKLFYHYLNEPNIDIRIIEETRFEYIKGGKFLCIPEEYGRDEEYYLNFLYNQAPYDGVFMHGNIQGAIYTQEEPELGSEKAPTFKVSDFRFSRGPIIAGHVHVPGCYEKYAYYCGSPYRWQFGEEQSKGFYIVLRDLNDGSHYTHFEEIISEKYVTISIDDLLMIDPKDAINYINDLKEKDKIDHIRLQFKNELNDSTSTNLQLIKNFYRTNSSVKIHHKQKKKRAEVDKDSIDNEVMEKYRGYEYIIDPSLSEYEILTHYINDNKGYEFITVDELMDILKEL